MFSRPGSGHGVDRLCLTPKLVLARADTVCLTSCLTVGQVAAITGALVGLPYPGGSGSHDPRRDGGACLCSRIPVWFWHNTSAGHLRPRRCCLSAQPDEAHTRGLSFCVLRRECMRPPGHWWPVHTQHCPQPTIGSNYIRHIWYSTSTTRITVHSTIRRRFALHSQLQRTHGP